MVASIMEVTMTDLGTIGRDWFPENWLADVLAGRDVEVDIGQVKGAWRKALQREVRAGRLVTWRGRWFPIAGARFGIGPLKTCYGTVTARDLLQPIPN